MRISKEKATNVAEKLLNPKREKLENLRKELSDYVTEIAKSHIPKPVNDMFKEYPEYVNSVSNSIQIEGEFIDNWSLKHRHISETIPHKNKPILVTKNQSKKIRNLFDKEERMRLEINKLRREIENAVFNLRTYSRCEKEFPEAFKFLPKKNITTALQVNVQDIRSKLKD